MLGERSMGSRVYRVTRHDSTTAPAAVSETRTLTPFVFKNFFDQESFQGIQLSNLAMFAAMETISQLTYI